MIGHERFLSETNQRHLIAVCQCGWVGTPTTWRTVWDAKTERNRVHKEATIDVVNAEHDAHLLDVQADIERRSATVIADNAQALDRLIPTMLRPGRFGHG